MDKLKEFKQERAADIKEARKILDVAETDKRDLNEDEQAKYDELMAKVEAKGKMITTEENQIKLESGLEKIEPIKNEPEVKEEKKFGSFGEQLKAVIDASTPGRRGFDERLVESRIATGAGETVPADGGFLVQTDFAAELLKKVFETGVLASRVNKVGISSNANGLKINAVDEESRVTGCRWGGIQTYWAAEADTVTATKPKFRQMELKLNKLMGLCYATEELLQDTSALESIITQAFTEEFGFIIDYSILRGSGSGQPLGIMSAPSLISVTRSGANTVANSDITGMWSRLFAPSRKNAVWFINQLVEPYLYNMTVADAGYIPTYMPPGGVSG